MKNKIVKLININDKYLDANLKINMHGIVLKEKLNYSEVLFINEKNVGDYAVIEVLNNDIKIEKEQLPNKIFTLLSTFTLNLNKTKHKKLTLPKFKMCDFVEVIVEKEKYIKEGVHKGDRGYVALDNVIENEMLIDFTKIDENEEVLGDLVYININDLELVHDSEDV